MANKPTLALIPSAYKANKVYSVLPNNGDGDFTFNRASSSATRVNKDGLIETVASNVPRLDYSDGSCPSLLLEPRRTNTFLNSEPTSNEGATGSITYESHFWENGLQNAVRFTSGVTGYRYGGTATSSTTMTISCYVKMDDGGEPFMGGNAPIYDLALVIGSSVITNTEKEYISNGIWKIFGTHTATFTSGDNGVVKYSGQSDRGFICTGFQLEAGNYPTSYIPTSGSTVTRNADWCYGAGNSDLFNTTSGVIYLKLKAIGIEPIYFAGLSLSDSTFANRIEFRYIPNSNILQLVVRVASSAVVVLGAAIPDITEIHKVAIEFEADNYAFWVNGVKVRTDTSGALPPNLSEFAFDDGGGANRINAKIYDARVYNTALTDEELQELTTL